MYMVVGLGNPGKDYAGNRHNVGFMAADEIFCRYNFNNWQKKFNAESSLGEIEGHKTLLLKPQTYMNLSGNAIIEAAHFYKIFTEDIYIIHDDLDLELGKIKAKQGGGSGGHNGLKSADKAIGSNYHRIRIGIGHPQNKTEVTNYVLHDFSRQEKEIIDDGIFKISANLPEYLSKDSAAFLNKINQK